MFVRWDLSLKDALRLSIRWLWFNECQMMLPVFTPGCLILALFYIDNQIGRRWSVIRVYHSSARITKAPVLRSGDHGKYLYLNMISADGPPDARNKLYLQALFQGRAAEQIISAKVKPGSRIEIVGAVKSVDTYQPADSEDLAIVVHLKGYDWEFADKKFDDPAAGSQSQPVKSTPARPPDPATPTQAAINLDKVEDTPK